jgi:hypothetical protein
MWQRQKSKTFELVFNPGFPYFFVPGALVLAVAGGSLYDLLKKLWGDETSSLGLILVLSLIALGLLMIGAHSVGAVSLALRREALVPERIAVKPKPPQRKGLIAFVSKREHVEKAIAYHSDTLEHVWLIATGDAESLAYEIKEKHDGGGIKFEVVPLADEFDVQKAQAVVEGIYETRLDGMAEEDVTADFTGGTKPMTVGMIFACLSPARKLQYVPASREGAGLVSLEPIEFNVNGPGAEGPT